MHGPRTLIKRRPLMKTKILGVMMALAMLTLTMGAKNTGCGGNPPPPPQPVCGDDICSGGETYITCPPDCSLDGQ